MFAALHTLKISYAHIEPTTRLLSLCDALPLRDFHVNIAWSDTNTADELHNLFAAISSSILQSSITTLTIDNDCHEDFWGRIPGDVRMYGHSLRLLFHFVNLAFVSIKSPGTFDFDNATVSTLAHAWPLIETLQLEVTFPLQGPKATLECLQYLARCAHLHTSTIALDCSVAPVTGSISPFQSAMTELNIGFSPITAPATAVALFISDVFPNLEQISSSWDIGTQDDDVDAQIQEFRPRWEEVDIEIRAGAALIAASSLTGWGN
ncbi:hypothetical protein B0H19DRAFT_1259080 [Mycena capillaripes]|nr:hypothetical protein B0H19DRAFT_1259080 [Mycena capillaripes]